MGLTLPALIQTDRRVGGLRIWLWVFFARRIYRLSGGFGYRSRVVPGVSLWVPAGFETDLVSAPWQVRWLLPVEAMAFAAVVHDYLRSQRHDLHPEVVDLVFREVMIASGVSKICAELAYQAVRANNNRA